jgi:hypothetical protein
MFEPLTDDGAANSFVEELKENDIPLKNATVFLSQQQLESLYFIGNMINDLENTLKRIALALEKIAGK